MATVALERSDPGREDSRSTMASSNGGPRHGFLRTVAIFVGALLALFATFIALAIGLRKPIAERLLLDELLQRFGGAGAAFGDGELAVSVTQFGRDHLQLRGLRIGDSLRIASLDAHYSPTGLIASRLDSIRVSGLRVRGKLDETGVSLGRLDAMLGSPTTASRDAPDPASATSLPSSLPTSRIELDDAQIELDTPEGPLLVTMGSRVSQRRPGELEATVELDVDHRLASLSARLTAEGGGDEWSGQASLEATLSGTFGPSLQIGDLTLSARPTFRIDPDQIAIRADECIRLRVGRLEIANGPRLTGPLELCARSESIALRSDGESSLDVVVSIEPFSVEFGSGERLQVASKISQLKIQGRSKASGELSGSLSAERGHVVLPYKIGARGLQLQATQTEASTAIAELRVDSLFDTQDPARFVDLGLRATLTAIDPSVRGPIGFDLEIADAERNVVIALAGKHDSNLESGRASLRMQPFVFCPDGPQLTSVLPALKGIADDAQGSIEASGTFAWGADTASGKLHVGLSGVSATTSSFEIERLYATVSLSESGTAPGQLLSIGRIDFGLELTDGEVLFQILPDGQVSIESAVWAFAGGQLSTSGLIDPAVQTQSLVFDVRDVDLATLLELVALEGLSGTGTFEGRLPLDRVGDQIFIRDASLHSGSAGGIIQYRPEGGAANLGAAQKDFGEVLSVLEDFRYSRVSLTIAGDAAGEVEVAIRLEGMNPSYEGGHPVDFNLSVEGLLSDLISDAGAVYQIPFLIEERFEDLFGPQVNLSPRPCVHPSDSVDDHAPQR